MIERLNQPDAADLKQIIHIFSAVMESLQHAEHEPQIAPDEFLPRLQIAAVDEGKELPHALVADDGERGGIHAADFNFADSQ